MERYGAGLLKTPVEEELVGRVAWQIQLRWVAAAGVLVAAWVAIPFLPISIPLSPLVAIGLSILVYNTLFHLYLRRLQRAEISDAATFRRFATVQTAVDWLAMILLVHFSGGLESPIIFYFIFHLIIASILLSPRVSYLFAGLAALAVGVLGLFEYADLLPHVPLGFFPAGLYQDPLYVSSVLFFFTTTLLISVYLATSVTINLRQKDEELLRLQAQLAGAYGRLQTLYEVTRTAGATLNLDEVLNLIARSAAEAMHARACTIRLLDESGRVVETVAAYGLSEQYLLKGTVDVERSQITRQALSGRPAIIADVSRDERLQYPAEAQAEGIASLLCVPLFIRDKAEGTICVYSDERDRFAESDAEFLSTLAGEGATAIVNARAYQALEMADRAKSDFVRMVTHELRSPLAAVQSMLRLIQQGYVGPLTSRQEDMIQRSQRRIAFLLTLVGDLLELAAGKMERLRGERQPLVVNDVVQRVVDLMQARAAEKHLAFQVEVDEAPLPLVGVEEGIERVYMNLIGNAIKYTPDGGHVRVRVWGDGDQIHSVVSDSGIGIPEEALPLLFDEFYRAPNARAIEMEGTGLGLAIVKDVVEQHNGQVSVESVVGEGTTFSVLLPRQV
ncbi:MAG: GAF domain-containing protein [Anaerolineae bacterium]|nr:GAF domain-containing protein [Anaerolineae bacterium]